MENQEPHITTSHQTFHSEPPFFEKHKWVLKGMLILVLMILFLIPQAIIQGVINERKENLQSATQQITTTWSDSQIIAGPIIAIPYFTQSTINDANNKPIITRVKSYAYLMPDALNIKTEVIPDTKKIGMFKVGIYNCKLNANGNFKNAKWEKLSIPAENIYWNDVRILVGLSDFKGLEKEFILNWDGTDYTAEMGFEDKDILKNVLSIAVPISLETITKEHSFKFDLMCRGSSSINFIPVGNQTHVDLITKWKSPRYTGNFPANHNDATKENIAKASWNVMGINRTFPQQWKSQDINIFADSFGMSLIQSVDSYGKIMRTIKYAMLFILLTFMIYFFVEVLTKKSAHIIQYALVGFALTVFYLLLLSISEYTGFESAYFIAALATILLVGTYTKSVFVSWKTSAIFSGFLVLLYTFLYVLIQLQDNALLLGSIALFIILSVVMYLSRNVNWALKK